MTLCLMQAIVDSNKDNNKPYKLISQKIISKYYWEWIKSDPFDKGKATFLALGKLKKDPEDYKKAK